VGKQHGNLISLARIARAGYDHARELDLFGQARSLQSNGHFGPGRQGLIMAKFNPVFPNMHRIGWHGETLGLVWRQSERVIFDFSGAHTLKEHITICLRVNHPFFAEAVSFKNADWLSTGLTYLVARFL
jgi:hypothetical protein